jgi:hypothetical protein
VIKLRVRLGKAYFYTGDYEATAKVLKEISSTALDKTTAGILEASLARPVLSRERSVRLMSSLPTTRAPVVPTIEWFPVGNEKISSIMVMPKRVQGGAIPMLSYGPADLKKIYAEGYTNFRFFFGGVCDPRHILETLHDFHGQLKDATNLRIELHINDNVPEVLARDILLMCELRDLAQFTYEDVVANQPKDDPSPSTLHAAYIAHLWFGYNLLPYQDARLKETLSKLIELSADTQAFATDPFTNWIQVEPAALAFYRQIWVYWRDEPLDYYTEIKQVKDAMGIQPEQKEELLEDSTTRLKFVDGLDEGTLNKILIPHKNPLEIMKMSVAQKRGMVKDLLRNTAVGEEGM